MVESLYRGCGPTRDLCGERDLHRAALQDGDRIANQEEFATQRELEISSREQTIVLRHCNCILVSQFARLTLNCSDFPG